MYIAWVYSGELWYVVQSEKGSTSGYLALVVTGQHHQVSDDTMRHHTTTKFQGKSVKVSNISPQDKLRINSKN